MILEIVDEGIQEESMIPQKACCWFVTYPYCM